MWATENNQNLLMGHMRTDFDAFGAPIQEAAGKALVGEYVPIEAKIGRALIGGMSMIGDVLYRSLYPFIRILMLVLFAFWVFMEGYNLIKTGGAGTKDDKGKTSGGDAMKVGFSIVKKAMWVLIWFILLSNDPAKIFMWVMSPIITLGTTMSNLILNAVANAAHANLPDTCHAIQTYMSAHPISENIINTSSAADMLCVPTRLSGFFYTAVAAGFKWMGAGIGHSAMTFAVGAVFVVIFIYNIWKFAIQAIGIIASLFLAVLLLPFTAVVETFGDGTTYKGPFGEFFTMFANMFGKTRLNAQMMTFVNATIYFIVLSVVAAIGMAILAQTVQTDFSAAMPLLTTTDGWIVTLIAGCLVAYLAGQAGTIAKDIGVTLDKSGMDFAKKVGDDVSKAWKNTTTSAKSWWKAFRKK